MGFIGGLVTVVVRPTDSSSENRHNSSHYLIKSFSSFNIKFSLFIETNTGNGSNTHPLAKGGC